VCVEVEVIIPMVRARVCAFFNHKHTLDIRDLI
jgi:hypothetical protein